ncbi:MAG: type II toxin-antitoxin system Phd/YefM family antitoxin [Xanthomonadaceae bacterium]|nr:type II toxin-antitoxin system Phd/YefM family antitoxin [Xanthomonadaceae bacterium]
MNNTITAQEIKRRGISAVDEALEQGPVHVIQRNRPRYVILSEEDYARLADRRQARAELWEQLTTGSEPGSRGKSEIDAQLAEERASWDGPARGT